MEYNIRRPEDPRLFAVILVGLLSGLISTQSSNDTTRPFLFHHCSLEMSSAALSVISADIVPLFKEYGISPSPSCPLHFSKAKPAVDWFSQNTEKIRGGQTQSKLLSHRPEFENADYLEFHLTREALQNPITLNQVSALEANFTTEVTTSSQFDLGEYLVAPGLTGFGSQCPAQLCGVLPCQYLASPRAPRKGAGGDRVSVLRTQNESPLCKKAGDAISEENQKLRRMSLRGKCTRVFLECVDKNEDDRALQLLEVLVERYCVGQKSLGCLTTDEEGPRRRKEDGVKSNLRKDENEDFWFAMKIIGGILAIILSILYYAAFYIGYYASDA